MPVRTPLTNNWPARRPIVRVHALGRGPAEFASGAGAVGRFHPVRASDGSMIPWLYGAEDDEGAIREIVLHDVPAQPDGLLWQARPNDATRSLMLFGDRVSEADLEVIDEPILLVLGEGLDRVRRILTAAGIVLVPAD